jgi:hypothetical protein
MAGTKRKWLIRSAIAAIICIGCMAYLEQEFIQHGHEPARGAAILEVSVSVVSAFVSQLYLLFSIGEVAPRLVLGNAAGRVFTLSNWDVSEKKPLSKREVAKLQTRTFVVMGINLLVCFSVSRLLVRVFFRI